MTALKIGLHENQMRVYESKARFICLNCGRRFGKALGLDVPILLGDMRWTTIGELKEGDFVFDETGSPVRVSYVSEIYYNRPCYKVVFSDGSEIVADGQHDWITEDKSYRKNSVRTPHTSKKPEKRTTEQIKNTLLYKRNDGKVEYNHAVVVAAPLQCPQADLLLDPYLLGVWLGDGCATNGEITCADHQIIQIINTRGYETYCFDKIQYRVYNGKQCDGIYNKWKKSSIQPELKSLGVFDNKHIPRCYFSSSIEQRIDLLRGLMDTDGTISKYGHCEFSVCNKQLAEDFRELLSTLGQKSTISESDAKLYGRVTSTRYRITFTPTFDPFYLDKKSMRYRGNVKSEVKRRFVVDVIPIESVPVRCISVENKSHLFLAGKTLIPTHNTWFAAAKVIIAAIAKPDGIFWLLSPTFPQTDIMWRMIIKLLPKSYIKDISLSKLRIELKNGASIWAKSADKYDNLRGEGLDGVVLDEAAMIHPDAWFKVIRPALMDKLGWAMFCTTPRGKNWYYKLYKKGDKKHATYSKNWESFTFSSYDNPFLERSELEEIVQDLSELEYEQEILAIFLSDGGTVFKNIDACTRKHISDEYRPGVPYVMGVDLGRHQDFTVIHVGDTLTKELVYHERFNQTSWSHIKARIIDVYDRYGSPPVFLDTTGVGDAIHEDLETEGVHVVSYKFTLESKKELVKRLSVALHNCAIYIPDDASLREELESFTYTVTDSGNIKYGAPKGFFDDQVCALMLMNYGMNGGVALCIGGLEEELSQEDYEMRFEKLKASRSAVTELEEDAYEGDEFNWDSDEFYDDSIAQDGDSVFVDAYEDSRRYNAYKRGGYIEV